MKRFIFWDYPRASFPYDIMVALILAFIFLTPAEIFDDRPKATAISMVTDGVFMITSQDLAGQPAEEQMKRSAELIRKRFGENATVLKVEPLSPEQEVKGFMAYTKR